METPNQNPKVDTLTLQLQKSIEFEALKRENKALKEENARLQAALKKTKASAEFIKAIQSASNRHVHTRDSR